jgi:hypothetical protein
MLQISILVVFSGDREEVEGLGAEMKGPIHGLSHRPIRSSDVESEQQI